MRDLNKVLNYFTVHNVSVPGNRVLVFDGTKDKWIYESVCRKLFNLFTVWWCCWFRVI